MELPPRFTYPFRYVPHPLVVDAARALISRLDGSPSASAFREGKMLGVLLTDGGPLYAFSGLVGGQAVVPGFVPPVFDLTKGYFKQREAEISAMPERKNPNTVRQLQYYRRRQILWPKQK